VHFEFGSLILGAYLLGSVPSAYLAGKWSHGIDIRQYGSGNVGATNLLSLTSRRVVIPVIIFDLFKGGILVWVARWLGLSLAEQVGVGLVAVSGHNWSCFLRFNGGRGVITAMGAIFMLVMINNLVSLGIAVIITVVLNAVVWISRFYLKCGSWGVFIIVAAIPLIAWGLGTPLPFTLGCLGMFLMLVIRRLTAPQPISVTSISKKQVVLNRLLFDRDIKEKELWVSLVVEEQKEQRKLVGNRK